MKKKIQNKSEKESISHRDGKWPCGSWGVWIDGTEDSSSKSRKECVFPSY